MFLDKPINGHGPKLFRIKCKEKKYNEGLQNACDTHPHNFYIQLLSETGVLGFAFLFGSFLFLVFKITQNFCRILLKKKILFNDYQICLLSGLLITLWPIIPNGNFFNNYLMILYSLQIGFFKAYKAKVQN
jgi:O-antigen ligase